MKPRPIWIAAVLATIHFGLAIGFALATPYMTPGVSQGQRLPDIGAPDERAHVLYVSHLMRGEGLPVLDPANQEAYQAHQPPLYYWLDAAAARATGVADVRDPHSALAARWLNAAIGAGTVVGVFCLGLWATRRAPIALLAGAVVAFLPMNVAMSGAVSNDPLTFLLCTWGLGFFARAFGGEPSEANRWLILTGVAVGLSILTKASGVILLVAVFVGAVSDSRLPRRAVAGLVLVSIAIALPMWVRNVAVYHDPLAMSAFNRFFHHTTNPGELIHSPRALVHWGYVLLGGTLLSFVGEFGYMDIHLPYALYIPLLTVIAVCLALGLRSWTKAITSKPTRVAFAGFAGLIALSYVAFNLTYTQPQARYLYPAIGPMAVTVALGLDRLSARRFAAAALALAVALVATDFYALSILPAEFRSRVDAWRSGR